MSLFNFTKFKNLNDVKDGDHFIVVYPNGSINLCWYSRRGYFRSEVDYDLIQDINIDEVVDLPCTNDLLVCKVNLGE